MILVTRPLHLAHSLCNTIKNQGDTPILFPTLEIEAIQNNLNTHDAIKTLNHFDTCIFTSQNAVLYFEPLFRQYWTHMPDLLKIVAIGQATLNELTRLGIETHVLPKHYSTEGVLELEEFQHVQDQKILIITGENGRTLLQETLTNRGAKVSTAVTYRRCRPTHKKLPVALSEIDTIISTSEESLMNLCELLKVEISVLLEKQLIVFSDRIAKKADELGFVKKTLVTRNASDEAVIECLIKFSRHSEQLRSKVTKHE